MAGSDSLMRLLDASLIAELEHGADVFPDGFKAWCELNGIPRSTAYRHRRRIQEQGRWVPGSHRPMRSPNRTPEPVAAAVVTLRGQLGRDNGAENIQAGLHGLALEQGWAGQGWTVPSRATIHKILQRQGLVVPAPQKRPRSSYRRFAYARPRDCYQIDATTVRLADGAQVVVFEVLDDCTRTLVSTLAAAAETATAAVAAISNAFTDFGVPALVLSDNGAAFTSRYTGNGVSRFTRVVTDTGARLIHSSPYHPQTCGKVERHHRTFKDWLTDTTNGTDPAGGADAAGGRGGVPAPTTLADLQALCDRYQAWYNTERRHSAVHGTPWQAWQQAPELGQPSLPPRQQDATISTPLVCAAGRIMVNGTRITVGRDWTGHRLTAISDGDHVSVYQPDGRALGHLNINRSVTTGVRLTPAA